MSPALFNFCSPASKWRPHPRLSPSLDRFEIFHLFPEFIRTLHQFVPVFPAILFSYPHFLVKQKVIANDLKSDAKASNVTPPLNLTGYEARQGLGDA